MISSEILTFIRREIARQVAVVLSGSAQNAQGQVEDISALYPGMPVITERPVMHPFGYVSRAPNGTIQVTARQGSTPENRLVLGHRDANRPALDGGEVVLYNAHGQQIRLNAGVIQLGGPDSAEPIVLGAQLKELLTELIAAVSALSAAAASTAATTSGALVTLGLPPPPLPGPPASLLLDAAAATAAGSAATDAGNNFVQNDAILSDESFARKGGEE